MAHMPKSSGLPLSFTPLLAEFQPSTLQTEVVIQEEAPGRWPLTSDTYPGTFSDFHGLPSRPICVYRTGDVWQMASRGLENYAEWREAHPVGDHPIREAWFDLGEQIYKYLDSVDVNWSTIDPVRFAKEREKPGPPHLWVGVRPGSLSLRDAKAAAIGCKNILASAGLHDVEIAFRESVYTQSAGPKLLDYVPWPTPTIDLASPFTPALGTRIAPRKDPNFEGTGALYLRESSRSDRLFLLTARHVALPSPLYKNDLYDHMNAPWCGERIIILGNEGYSKAIGDMMAAIGHKDFLIRLDKRDLESLGEPAEGEDSGVTERRQTLQTWIAREQKAITEINKLHTRITKNWTPNGLRTLGSVVYSPPISFGTGPEQYTEDWALIDVSRDKIDLDQFKGNVIHLGNQLIPQDPVKKMHPYCRECPSFKFPVDGVLQIQGILPKEDICNPRQVDTNGEPCLFVIKNGRTTGVTIGRSTGLESFVRVFDRHGLKQTSREYGVLPYNCRLGRFSAIGDSGSIIVDDRGYIVGLLTGGSGTTESIDVSYMTPYFWLDERIKKSFPEFYLYPQKD